MTQEKIEDLEARMLSAETIISACIYILTDGLQPVKGAEKMIKQMPPELPQGKRKWEV